MLQIIQERF